MLRQCRRVLDALLSCCWRVLLSCQGFPRLLHSTPLQGSPQAYSAQHASLHCSAESLQCLEAAACASGQHGCCCCCCQPANSVHCSQLPGLIYD